MTRKLNRETFLENKKKEKKAKKQTAFGNDES
jgi:hypothetical protein